MNLTVFDLFPLLSLAKNTPRESSPIFQTAEVDPRWTIPERSRTDLPFMAYILSAQGSIGDIPLKAKVTASLS